MVIFVVSAILVYFITTPGMYLILRTRLASSLIETLSTGFFLGLGLVVLSYLGLSRCVPVFIIDIFIIVSATASLILLIKELRWQELPTWIMPNDRIQALLVGFAFFFLVLFAFGDLSYLIDDDLFIHLPNIKRIAMGDIPPHMPFFPSTYLRGHVGRDIFTGVIARFLSLKPELAVIYVTLALCPVYIFVFHALARRLAGNDRTLTCFCFFGLLFLVSCSIGTSEIRAGCITYIWNNNAVAWGYAAFIGWLIERISSVLKQSKSNSLITILSTNKLLIIISILAYTALYFIYISNFLMFSLFLPFLPALLAITSNSKHDRLRNFVLDLIIIGTIVCAAWIFAAIISPLLLERIMISLSLYHPNEPMGFLQQGQFVFPKEHLFAITDPSGRDIPFLTGSSLSAQGLSFYIGLSGLVVGILSRKITIAATSLFGWLIELWMMLVDMGQFRAETLRLMIAAHMAFGASTGLMIGLGVRYLLMRIQRSHASHYKISQIAVMASAIGFSAWMAKGNMEKFMAARHWDIATNCNRMRKIHIQDPENWHIWLNMPRIDFETFQILSDFVRNPRKCVLLKLTQDEKFIGAGEPANKIAQMINCATMTGAGIVGVTQEHAPPHMSVALFRYDYRASLFWQRPTADLLAQLSPDWLVVDPSLVSHTVLDTVFRLPGIAYVRKFEDNAGRQRLLLSYTSTAHYIAKPSGIKHLILDSTRVETSAFGLVELPVDIDTRSDTKSPSLKMQIFDDRMQLVNVLDDPAVGIVHSSKNHYNLYFSMIQPGRWTVYFVDPLTQKHLNSTPLLVTVNDSAARI